ncbi:MAG TPA: hypothetical protein VJV79_24305 [Polyangiaceae bacterium]|nr:hypothetical protein [Polyangiaceae bacterium]
MKPQLLILPLLGFVGYSASALAQGAPPPGGITPGAPPAAAPEAPPAAPGAPPPAAADAVASAPPTAQPQEPAAAPPPNIDLSTAPLTKAVQRTYHVHEGFYLRASVGFGYYTASFNDGNRSNLDFRNHGGDMALDLLIGGSPSPGVSIGGGLLLNPQFGADYERDENIVSDGDRLGSHGGFSSLLGPFIDGFPDVNNGWHLGGLIGLAGQSFQNVNATGGGRTERALGIGGAAWFGYDFWVAGEWAIGPQVRVMGMRTQDTKSDENISAFASSIDFGISALFN